MVALYDLTEQLFDFDLLLDSLSSIRQEFPPDQFSISTNFVPGGCHVRHEPGEYCYCPDTEFGILIRKK